MTETTYIKIKIYKRKPKNTDENTLFFIPKGEQSTFMLLENVQMQICSMAQKNIRIMK
jgi:hypothetical protein